jgi:hypothetical protein
MPAMRKARRGKVVITIKQQNADGTITEINPADLLGGQPLINPT